MRERQFSSEVSHESAVEDEKKLDAARKLVRLKQLLRFKIGHTLFEDVGNENLVRKPISSFDAEILATVLVEKMYDYVAKEILDIPKDVLNEAWKGPDPELHKEWEEWQKSGQKK
jgi:hypothetical protein